MLCIRQFQRVENPWEIWRSSSAWALQSRAFAQTEMGSRGIQMKHLKIILFASFHWKNPSPLPIVKSFFWCQTSKKFSFSVLTENRGNPQIGVYGRNPKEWLDNAGYSHHRSLAFSKGKLFGFKNLKNLALKKRIQTGVKFAFVCQWEFGLFNRRKLLYRLLGCNNELLLPLCFLTTIPPLKSASWHNRSFVACKP